MLSAGLGVAGCTHAGGSATKGGLVTVAASRSDVAQAFEGRRFALVVGINEAGHERWRSLRFARKDAVDLGAVLADPALGAFSQVKVLTSREETTARALRDAVKALAAQATRPDDIIVLYFSAHGTLAHDTKGRLQRYLVTSDAEFHRAAETALPVSEVLELVNASSSRRRVVVLATCHSGGVKSALPDEVQLVAGQRLDVETLVEKREPWVSVTVLGGVYGFLDAATRAQLVPSAPSVGAGVRFDRVGLRQLSLEVDVSGWGGTQSVEPTPDAPAVPFQYASVLGGASVLFRWEPRIFSLRVGPRVAGLWVQRSFSLEAYAGNQAAFSVTPGVLAGDPHESRHLDFKSPDGTAGQRGCAVSGCVPGGVCQADGRCRL